MPNVWELGEEGLLFENSYICQPVCGPAHAIGSGMMKHSSSVYFDDFSYDLKNDPHEKNNLVNNKMYKNVIKEMRETLTKEMIKVGEKKPIFYKPLIKHKY